MTTVIPFITPLLRKDELVFDPDDIQAMSVTLDAVCEALKLNVGDGARETIAARIVDLVRRGERSPTRLRERVLAEANGGQAVRFSGR